MKTRWSIAGVCLAALTLLFSVNLAGCQTGAPTGGSGPAQTIRLTEVVHSVFYAPMYIAIHQGYFTEQGLDINLTTGWGGDKAMTALVADQSDIALIGPETTIFLYQQGSAKNIVSFAQLTQKDGSFLVSRPGVPFTWEGLQGKTIIGARKGGVPEMVLEWTLKNKGLHPFQNVNILQNIQFTATAGSFQGGTGDYVALFEPTATQLERAGAGTVVASFGAENKKITYTVFMASKDYLAKNRLTAVKFTKALYKAQQWVANHSDAEIALALQPAFPTDDPAVIQTAVARYRQIDAWAPNPLMQADGLEYLQDIMASAGELKARIPQGDLMTNEIAQEAMK